jgi:hypothetical protein
VVETFLYVWVCLAPLTAESECRRVETYESPSPIQCQHDRILVSSVWKDRVREMHGPGWAVFTDCGGPAVERLLKGSGQ